MIRDQDIIEENAELLLRRWRRLTTSMRANDSARLGMDHEVTAELRKLDANQVMRAADSATPLFHFSQPDDVILRVLSNDQKEHSTPIKDELDALVEEENHLMLMNRWAAARVSAVHAQCVLGLSEALVKALERATVNDLMRAAKYGIRLGKLAPKAKYLFHAGRNMTLQRPHRTVMAVCSSVALFC